MMVVNPDLGGGVLEGRGPVAPSPFRAMPEREQVSDKAEAVQLLLPRSPRRVCRLSPNYLSRPNSTVLLSPSLFLHLIAPRPHPRRRPRPLLPVSQHIPSSANHNPRSRTRDTRITLNRSPVGTTCLPSRISEGAISRWRMMGWERSGPRERRSGGMTERGWPSGTRRRNGSRDGSGQ